MSGNNDLGLDGPDEPGLERSPEDKAFGDIAALEAFRAALERQRGKPVGIVEAATKWEETQGEPAPANG